MASLWHAGAQLTRADIFGRADPLRPGYDTLSNSIVEAGLGSSMGMVGAAYLPSSLSFVSVNPAVESGREILPADDELYRMVEQLRDAKDESKPGSIRSKISPVSFTASMPTWTIMAAVHRSGTGCNFQDSGGVCLPVPRSFSEREEIPEAPCRNICRCGVRQTP